MNLIIPDGLDVVAFIAGLTIEDCEEDEEEGCASAEYDSDEVHGEGGGKADFRHGWTFALAASYYVAFRDRADTIQIDQNTL